MAERKQIALIYSRDKGWIAGAYYIQNLISALNTLDDSDKPTIVLVSNCLDNFEHVKKVTGYPYLEYEESYPFYSFRKRCINFLSRTLLDRDICRPKQGKVKADLIFPIQRLNDIFPKIKNLVWIPDFQHKYLSSYFQRIDLKTREYDFKIFARSGYPIVFSSNSAQNDFRKFYPDYFTSTTTFVLPFAVTLPNYSGINIAEVKVKYSIKDNFFFCANQFWQHKNHLRLFEAIKKVVNAGYNIQLVCSGNTTDYRNPNYFIQIEEYLKQNNLHECIKILGFIDRGEQLCLINNSLAVVQPSLFEGWSTVIEDAKALNKFVLASNLDVHREQLPANGSFFDPYNVDSLADVLISALSTPLPMTKIDYSSDVKEFGRKFKQIIDFIK